MFRSFGAVFIYLDFIYFIIDRIKWRTTLMIRPGIYEGANLQTYFCAYHDVFNKEQNAE